MRTELIRCDVCKKEHDAQYVLPPEWIVTRQRTRYGIEEEQHFCSKDCLIEWATGTNKALLDLLARIDFERPARLAAMEQDYQAYLATQKEGKQ